MSKKSLVHFFFPFLIEVLKILKLKNWNSKSQTSEREIDWSLAEDENDEDESGEEELSEEWDSLSEIDDADEEDGDN